MMQGSTIIPGILDDIVISMAENSLSFYRLLIYIPTFSREWVFGNTEYWHKKFPMKADINGHKIEWISLKNSISMAIGSLHNGDYDWKLSYSGQSLNDGTMHGEITINEENSEYDYDDSRYIRILINYDEHGEQILFSTTEIGVNGLFISYNECNSLNGFNIYRNFHMDSLTFHHNICITKIDGNIQIYKDVDEYTLIVDNKVVKSEMKYAEIISLLSTLSMEFIEIIKNDIVKPYCIGYYLSTIRDTHSKFAEYRAMGEKQVPHRVLYCSDGYNICIYPDGAYSDKNACEFADLQYDDDMYSVVIDARKNLCNHRRSVNSVVLDKNGGWINDMPIWIHRCLSNINNETMKVCKSCLQ